MAELRSQIQPAAVRKPDPRHRDVPGHLPDPGIRRMRCDPGRVHFSSVHGIELIYRGYERFSEKLDSLGADYEVG